MKAELHDYQKYCVERLLEKNNMALFLDCGLGKTLISLKVINELMLNRLEIGRTLIIAPKKVAEATWSDEIDKWDDFKHLKVSKIMGTSKQRVNALYERANVYIISRDNVVWLVNYLKNKWFFDMVILDEMSSYKNSQAKRFKYLSYVLPHIKKIVGLTGTPSPNGLMDLWSQVFLLDRGERLGKTIGEYRRTYFYEAQKNGHVVYKYGARAGAEDAIKNKISDICISLRAEDYLNMPKLTYHNIPINLSSKTRKAYDDFEKDMLLEIDEECIDVGSAAALTNKLMQFCNGSVYNDEKEAIWVHDEKTEALSELIEELNGEHALIFYNFKSDLPKITVAIENLGFTYRVLAAKADQDAWNRGEIDYLIAHPASCAYGLNLQFGGHHMIWYGLTWSLELYQQAVARLHRQGQDKPVVVHHLQVKDSMDEEVLEALKGKAGVQDGLMNALKARITKIKEGK